MVPRGDWYWMRGVQRVCICGAPVEIGSRNRGVQRVCISVAPVVIGSEEE